MDRIASDHFLGLLQFDPRQLGSPLIQGFCRNAQSRHNRSAKIVRTGINAIKCSRRSEINDNQRALILFNRSNRIHNPVSTHLAWILIPQIKPGLNPRAYKQRLLANIFHTHFHNDLHKRWNNRGDNDPFHIFERNVGHMEQIMNQHPIFICSGLTGSTEAEMVKQLTPPVYPKDDISIAYIYSKHHEKGPSFLAFRSRLISRLEKE
ncbi:hypothetical protein D3C75_725830 [compost metagenome]